MTALAAARNTKQWGDRSGYEPEVLDIDVAANAKIWVGAIVVQNAQGFAYQGSTVTGNVAIGRAIQSPGFSDVYDNTGGADKAFKVRIRRGVFQYANSTGADLLAVSDRFAKCYVVDDQTVAKTSTGKSIAGMVFDVDANGVWVQLGYAGVSP